MSTEAITIQVDSQAASAFNKAPAEEQRKTEALLSLWLKEIASADTRPSKEVMDVIVVCGRLEEEQILIITAYEPDPAEWAVRLADAQEVNSSW